MAANRPTHALTEGKGMVFNRRGKETNARLDDSIFSSFFFFLSDAQANLFSKFCLYSLVPLFFFFYNEKTDFVGIMETVKGDIGYSARALQIHFCGNGLHGKDFFHRFYSSFIEFFFFFFFEIWDIFTIKCTIVYSDVILYLRFHSSNWISAKARRYVLGLYENLTFFNRTCFINKLQYMRADIIYIIYSYILSLYNLYYILYYILIIYFLSNISLYSGNQTNIYIKGLKEGKFRWVKGRTETFNSFRSAGLTERT